MKKISILDYGMGNIASLKNAIEKVGFEAEFFSSSKLINSNILVVPGVGAFNTAMNIFKLKKYDEVINNFLKVNDNFLFGICLGMQILLSTGEENEKTQGLNLINGNVSKLLSNTKIKLPNVGSREIKIKNTNKFNFLKQYNKEKFYFVHSYIAKPNNNSSIIATSKYEDVEFNSVISNDKNVFGTQFHPEKSSQIGLNFLEDFFKNILDR